MPLVPSKPIPALHAPLTDGQVTLRLTEERDIPEILVAHDDDGDLHRLRGLDRPPSGAELGRAAEEAPTNRAQGKFEELTIVAGDSHDGEFLGQVIVHSIDWQDRRAELGIWLKPQSRRGGTGRRALTLITGWLFDAWGLARVELHTDPSNEPMLGCAQTAGFVREGVLRSNSLVGGRRYDDVVLAILPTAR